jgi:hypothetical protein
MLLDGTTSIPGLGGKTFGHFWFWAYSNLIVNTTRSAYGEYLVASALGLDDEPRKEWTPYDLVYRDTTIEVKTSGYLQAWYQQQPSIVTFDIAPRVSTWKIEENIMTTLPEQTRVASLYVFCIHTAQLSNDTATERDLAFLMGAHNWCFHAAPTATIDRLFGKQKQVRYSILKSNLEKQGFFSTPYEQLKEAVDTCVEVISEAESAAVIPRHCPYDSPPRPA